MQGLRNHVVSCAVLLCLIALLRYTPVDAEYPRSCTVAKAGSCGCDTNKKCYCGPNRWSTCAEMADPCFNSISCGCVNNDNGVGCNYDKFDVPFNYKSDSECSAAYDDGDCQENSPSYTIYNKCCIKSCYRPSVNLDYYEDRCDGETGPQQGQATVNNNPPAHTHMMTGDEGSSDCITRCIATRDDGYYMEPRVVYTGATFDEVTKKCWCKTTTPTGSNTPSNHKYCAFDMPAICHPGFFD